MINVVRCSCGQRCWTDERAQLVDCEHCGVIAWVGGAAPDYDVERQLCQPCGDRVHSWRQGRSEVLLERCDACGEVAVIER